MEKSKRPKKSKVGGLSPAQVAILAREWNKCNFWVESKQRFCRLDRLCSMKPYCGEHLPAYSTVVGPDGVKMERIPCPIDSTHTCYKHLLESHLKKCNKKPLAVLPPYIQKGVNLVADLGYKKFSEKDSPHSCRLPSEKDKEERYKVIEAMNSEDFSILLEKIVSVHSDNKLTPRVEYGLSESVAGELCRSDIGEKAAKHLTQIASILNLLELFGLVRDNTAFVEYGGGRGTVTFHLANLVKEKNFRNCKFFVIDKASPRHKQDNKLADLGLNVLRIRSDISDVRVGELPGMDDPTILRIVGVTKHLCGVATDMALFSLLSGTSNSLCRIVSGFCFATCCHHRCKANSYAGASWLHEKNFTNGDMNIIMQMSSWATCGDLDGRIESVKPITESTLKYLKIMENKIPLVFFKNTIGELAKDILDKGRADFGNHSATESLGQVVQFTDLANTLENRALVMSPSSKKETSETT